MASPADSSDLYKSQIRDIAGQASDSPIWRTIPVQNWTTGDVISFDLTPYVLSPDGSAVVIAELGDSFPSALSIVSNVVTGTISALQGGTYEIVVTATNSTGTPISNILPAIVIGLEVTNPTMAALPDFPLQEVGGAFYLDLNNYITDDGDNTGVSIITFTYTATNGFPDGVDFGSNGIIAGTTITEQLITVINVTATNEALLSTIGDFYIVVNALEVISETPAIDGFYFGEYLCAASVAPTWASGADFYTDVSDTSAKSIDILSLYLASEVADVDLVLVSSGALPTGYFLDDDGTNGHGVGFIYTAGGLAPVGVSTFTLTARNTDALTSDPSPTFTIEIVNDSLVIPTLVNFTADIGTNDIYLNFSEPMEAVPALDYLSGTLFMVNSFLRNITYVSGDQTSIIRLLADGVAFTDGNTLRTVITNPLNNIQSVATGNLAADADITIYLSVPPVGNTEIRDWESFAIGDPLGGLITNPLAFKYDTGYNTFAVQSPAHSGSRACDAIIYPGTSGWGGNIDLDSRVTKGMGIWFRVYVRFPTGFTFTTATEGNKLMRLRVQNSSGGSVGHIGNNIKPTAAFAGLWGGSEIIDSAGNTIFNYYDPGAHPILRGTDGNGAGDIAHFLPDTWHAVEEYVHLDERPGFGIRRTWFDGQLVINDMITGTINASTDYIITSLFLSYWNAPLPIAIQRCYSDDFVLTSTTPTNTDSNGYPFIGL